MNQKLYLAQLLSTLNNEEKLYVALRFNQDLRSPNYMIFEPKTSDILVFCTKNKKYLPIMDELGEGCTNCKLASNISKITSYVNQYRSSIKKTTTNHPVEVS